MGEIGRGYLPSEKNYALYLSMEAFEESDRIYVRLPFVHDSAEWKGQLLIFALSNGEFQGEFLQAKEAYRLLKTSRGNLGVIRLIDADDSNPAGYSLSVYTPRGDFIKEAFIPWPVVQDDENRLFEARDFFLTEEEDLLVLWGWEANETGGIRRYRDIFSGGDIQIEEWDKGTYRPNLPLSRGGGFVLQSISAWGEYYLVPIDMNSDGYDGVLVLDKNLEFEKYITGEWFFNNPVAAMADSQGYIYISSHWTDNVKVYKGDRLMTVSARNGLGGSEGPLMNGPAALTVTGNKLFVFDSGNGRIQSFSTLGRGGNGTRGYYEQIPHTIVPRYSSADTLGAWVIPFILGLIFMAGLHGFFTAATTRDRSFLFYSFINFSGIPFFIERSYTRFFLTLPADSPSLFSWLLILSYFLFLWEYLSIKSGKRVDKILNYSALIISAGFLVLSIAMNLSWESTPLKSLVPVIDGGVILMIALMVILMLRQIAGGSQEAKLCLSLGALFAVGGILSTGIVHEALFRDTPFYQFTSLGYPLMLGFALQTLILSFTLGSRYNKMKVDREISNRENALLKELDREKTELIVNVSHELRTPLTVIEGIADRLSSGKQGDSILGNQASFQMIRRNTGKLLKHINNLLSLSLMEQKKVSPHLEPINLGDFLSLLTAEFASRAEISGIQLTCANRDDDLWIEADLSLLETIFLNLLVNALKFTPAGGDINLVSCRDRKTNLISVEIKDTGIGIPEEKQEDIFKRFFQADQSSSRRYEGAGIGLSLVREALQLQNGTIFMESREKYGTLFRVDFPALAFPSEGKPGDLLLSDEKLRQYGAEFDCEPKSGASGERAQGTEIPVGRILLVEDNEDLSLYMLSELESDFQIHCSRNGKEALANLKSFSPDLIISDVMMPEMDGKELFSRIMEKPEYRNIPFLFLTARIDTEEKLDFLSQGAMDYIEKPFSGRELKAKIRTIISRDIKVKEEYRHSIRESILHLLDNWDENEKTVSPRHLSPEVQLRDKGLTDREISVALLILSGKSDKEIAFELGISVSTVANHNSRIFQKTGVSNRVELLRTVLSPAKL